MTHVMSAALVGELHHYVMLEVGTNTMTLPDGFIVREVRLVGQRDREYPSMVLYELSFVRNQLKHLRAIPTMWAPDYRDKLIYVWPWASNTFKVHLIGEPTKKSQKADE